jgi:surface polysaccharide O-acyltransferase-like enzyme
MVVLLHCSSFPYKIDGEITSTVIANWFASDTLGAIGYLGVPLFIILSGALLLNPSKAEEPLRVYYKKRFMRVGLPMIFWTLLYFIWSFNVRGKPFTEFNVEQGLLTGAYPLMWFLYLIVGLYLVTPILRVLVAHIDSKKFTLLLFLWFAGTVITPIIHTFTDFAFNPLSFVVLDWLGYFLLGVYLLNAKVRSTFAYLGLFGGVAVAVAGAWLLTATMGEAYTGFFHADLGFNMIIASASLFILLTRFPQVKIENHVNLNNTIHWIGQNTLPIYLIHIMVLETLQLGLLGFQFPYTQNFLLDAFFLTGVTFAVSVAIIYPLKKMPYLSKLIG